MTIEELLKTAGDFIGYAIHVFEREGHVDRELVIADAAIAQAAAQTAQAMILAQMTQERENFGTKRLYLQVETLDKAM